MRYPPAPRPRLSTAAAAVRVALSTEGAMRVVQGVGASKRARYAADVMADTLCVSYKLTYFRADESSDVAA